MPCISDRDDAVWHLLLRVHDHIWMDKSFPFELRQSICQPIMERVSGIIVGHTRDVRSIAEGVLKRAKVFVLPVRQSHKSH